MNPLSAPIAAPARERTLIVCSKLHTGIVYNGAVCCALCSASNQLANRNISCAQTSFVSDQDALFTCGKGHTFAVNLARKPKLAPTVPSPSSKPSAPSGLYIPPAARKSGLNVRSELSAQTGLSTGTKSISDVRGCASCALVSRIYTTRGLIVKMDTKCAYLNEDSKLRFHCEGRKHNPLCTRPQCVINMKRNKWVQSGPRCTNFVKCDQDFYATPAQIMGGEKVLSCKHSHIWDIGAEVNTCLRVFETLYGERFDDQAPKVEFTGYNAKLGIAFTHNNDPRPQYCLSDAAIWCLQNRVIFIVIPTTLLLAPEIATFIVVELEKNDELFTTATNTIRVLRTRMKGANGRFDNLCVY